MTRLTLICVAVAVVRSIVLGVLVPPYQASDEPWHLDYARALAGGSLPVLGRTPMDPAIVTHDKEVTAERGLVLYGIDDPPMSREAFQPPLAYVVPAVAYAATGNRPAPALALFRAINALLGAALVAATAALGRAAFPGRPNAEAAGALVALGLPAVAIVSSTANNDALAALLGVGALVAVAVTVRRGATPARPAVIGLLIGAAALAKTTMVMLAVPAAVAALSDRAATTRQRRAAQALVPGLVAGAVLLPWVVRNLVVYGDLTGTSAFVRFAPVPGRSIGGLALFLWAEPALPAPERFWPATARSAIGVLGWSDRPLHGLAYAVGGVAVIAGVAATIRWLRRDADADDRRMALVLGTAAPALLLVAAWFAYSVDYQPQGRYVLVGILSAAVVVGAGLGRRGIAALAGVAAVLLASTFVAAASAF